jgi:hypothetical protein
MPKLVGSWNSTHCMYSNTDNSGAVALEPQAGKWFFSSENCNFNFLSWPPNPTLYVNVIDVYVERGSYKVWKAN